MKRDTTVVLSSPSYSATASLRHDRGWSPRAGSSILRSRSSKRWKPEMESPKRKGRSGKLQAPSFGHPTLSLQLPARILWIHMYFVNVPFLASSSLLLEIQTDFLNPRFLFGKSSSAQVLKSSSASSCFVLRTSCFLYGAA